MSHGSVQVEEFYVITWDAKKEQIFEMPTGGAAIMRQGANLLKLSRKEQCLALLAQLRTKFKTDGKVSKPCHSLPTPGLYETCIEIGQLLQMSKILPQVFPFFLPPFSTPQIVYWTCMDPLPYSSSFRPMPDGMHRALPLHIHCNKYKMDLQGAPALSLPSFVLCLTVSVGLPW